MEQKNMKHLCKKTNDRRHVAAHLKLLFISSIFSGLCSRVERLLVLLRSQLVIGLGFACYTKLGRKMEG